MGRRSIVSADVRRRDIYSGHIKLNVRKRQYTLRGIETRVPTAFCLLCILRKFSSASKKIPQ